MQAPSSPVDDQQMMDAGAGPSGPPSVAAPSCLSVDLVDYTPRPSSSSTGRRSTSRTQVVDASDLAVVESFDTDPRQDYPIQFVEGDQG